jgi:hypothetical protein
MIAMPPRWDRDAGEFSPGAKRYAMNAPETEAKVVYRDDMGAVRAIRGTVRIADGFVIVERRDGSIWIPISKVALVENWRGGEGGE